MVYRSINLYYLFRCTSSWRYGFYRRYRCCSILQGLQNISNLRRYKRYPSIRFVKKKTFSREWEFRSDFDKEPLTSDYAYKTTGSKNLNDEVHIILVDENGDWTGTKDLRGAPRVLSKSVLETFPSVSVANGAISSTGESIFYKDYINDHSEYIRWGDHAGEGDPSVRTNGSDSVQQNITWV